VDCEKEVFAMGTTFRFVAIPVIAVFCLAAQLEQRARAEDVNVAISTVGLYELPLEIAKEKGFYRAEGLNVRVIVVKTGLQASALAAGDLDFSTVGGAAIRAAAKGLPVKAVMGWWDRPLHILVGRPAIKDIKDLKNKKVAISSIGSTPYIMVREALSAEGMNPDHDVTFMSIGGSSARLAALQAGTVDATPVDVAFIEEAAKLGLHEVLYFGDMVNLPLGGLAASDNKIKTNPEQIRRMIRATLKGLRFLKANREETVAMLKRHLLIGDDYAGKVYDFAIRSVNDQGDIGVKSLANELRVDKEMLGLTHDISEHDVIDWRFVRAVAARN
jgi:ABC-type nitrate/sulfonate/bicarbonate transport system substrate-binding protein